MALSVLSLSGQNGLQWSRWAKDNVHSIRLSDTASFDDLEFLRDVLKDKRIVFLGENSHGISEFTTLKSRIIRFLHEELSFNVLAFEANASDAYAANFSIKNGDALSNIHNSISAYWHVEEIVPLFKYITQTHKSAEPINIAGIDLTLSNGNLPFTSHLHEILYPLNAEYAQEFYKYDSIFSIEGVQYYWMGNRFSSDDRNKRLKFEQEHLNRYIQLLQYLEDNKYRIRSDIDLKSAKHYIQNRIDYIHWRAQDTTYMAEQLNVTEKHWTASRLLSRYRDARMSNNLVFLSEQLYPDEKIIVWAHNAHIQKYGNDMPNHPGIFESAYTIPLFCYEGEGSWGKSFDPSSADNIYRFIISEDSTSIEKILNSTGYAISFVDMQNETKSNGNSWMFDKSRFHFWDGSNNSEVNAIRNLYDGIILIKQVNPPTYLNYDYKYFKEVIEKTKKTRHNMRYN